jgi:hypothetical protein
MENSWLVIWYNDGKKFRKVFPGQLPSVSGAADFYKKLQARGLTDVHIVSRVRAFPPLKIKTAPEPGMIWCPYCLKWRFFIERAIRTEGVVGPSLWRCPVCTISIKDTWVRKFNVQMTIKLDAMARERAVTKTQLKKVTRRR